MAGLNPLDEKELSPEMATLVEKFRGDGETANALKIFAHKQDVFAPMWNAYLSLLENGKLDRGLKELVRLKIAQNNDCSPYAEKSHVQHASSAVGLSPEKVAAIDHYEVSDKLTRREKLALKFAEKLGIEPEGLDDAFFAMAREEFSDPELMELAHVIATGISFERFLAVWKPRVCSI